MPLEKLVLLGVMIKQTVLFLIKTVILGLNPSNLTSEELVCWLEKWMKISKQVDDENISLLLHSPILLAYNEQSNWTLIYLKK